MTTDRPGAPHPALVVLGLLVAALATLFVWPADSRSMLLGGVVDGFVAAAIVWLGAFLGGGRAGRLRLVLVTAFPLFLGGGARRGGLRRGHLADVAATVRPLASVVTMIAGAAIVLAKPFARPVSFRTTESVRDTPMGPIVRTITREETFGALQGPHIGFLVGGVLLLLIALVVAVLPAKRA